MGSTSFDGPPRSYAARLPFYYGWVNLAVAVLASVSTLPGRTWGLGLITDQLLADFAIDAAAYAEINLWATLLGAGFCIPAGWLIDRLGARSVFVGVVACLGASVLAMSRAMRPDELLWTVSLTRGFGQSALSVVSLALVGKWFTRRINLSMSYWMVGTLFSFAAAEWALGKAANAYGWRAAWDVMGWTFLGLVAPLGWIFARSTPESCGLEPDVSPDETDRDRAEVGLSLARACRTPAFWAFVAGITLNSLSQAGISLFGKLMVKERGMGIDAFVEMLSISSIGALTGVGVALAGSRIWPLQRMVSVGLLSLMLSLVWLATVATALELYGAGCLWGASIGVLGVAGAALWRVAFGRAHLGSIQGAAGVCHVLSSASGPVLMVQIHALTGSYGPFFYGCGAALALAAAAVWFVRLPDAAACEAPVAEPDMQTS